MPSDERPTRRGADLTLTIGVLVAVFAALLPLMRVVRPSSWLLGAIVVAVAILAAGFIARRYLLPALAVSLVEAAVWVVFMMLVFLRDTALLWVIPTPETIRELPSLLAAAGEEIAVGAAPLDASTALSMLIVGGTGLLTIIVDHVVLTARMPLLAAIGLIAVSLIPSIAVPGEVDIMAFVLLAAAILFLIRTETRAREEPGEREATRSAGVPATSLGIGAIAVVVALVAVPLLPQPTVRAGSGTVGTGPGIDATLQLGDDLRRPSEVEVMLVRSNSPSAPYLRATTLSQLEGSVWEPDRVRTVPLGSDLGLGVVTVDEEIRLTEYVTTVEVINLASPWLPVSFPAVSVNGLQGDWTAAPYNRTVLSRAATTQGQNYEVVTNVPRPTLEQIRAREAGGPDQRDGTTALPEEIAPIVGDLALEVTAETTNDYDALVALQTWFRSAEFGYSLDAPVDEGFDGSGTDAVARFLEVRQGYCIHYASAFALMARTLGMPSRIVVGLSAGQRDQRRDRTRDRVLRLERSAACLARSAVRGHRLGAVRADQRPRRPHGLQRRGIRARRRGRPVGGDARAERVRVRRHRRVARRRRRRPERRGGRRHRNLREPAACAHGDARHPVRAVDPGADPRAAASADARIGPRRRCGRSLARRPGRRDRPGHRRSCQRDPAHARHAPGAAARRSGGRDEPADQRDRTGELCPGRQARVLAGRGDRGCRHHGAGDDAGCREHAPPSARAARAPLTHHPPRERLRRFGSSRARKVGWSAAREGHGGFA